MTAGGDRLGPTLFERSRPGRGGGKIPHPPKDALARIPADRLRAHGPRLPEVSESELTRHYVHLSQLNYSVDTGFYPLGSCTMKYNPKIDEWAARLPGFASLHPLAPDELAQGTLQFVEALRLIVAEAHDDPELLHAAPHETPVRRLDETTAARQPNLRWRAMTGSQTPCPD